MLAFATALAAASLAPSAQEAETCASRYIVIAYLNAYPATKRSATSAQIDAANAASFPWQNRALEVLKRSSVIKSNENPPERVFDEAKVIVDDIYSEKFDSKKHMNTVFHCDKIYKFPHLKP